MAGKLATAQVTFQTSGLIHNMYAIEDASYLGLNSENVERRTQIIILMAIDKVMRRFALLNGFLKTFAKFMKNNHKGAQRRRHTHTYTYTYMYVYVSCVYHIDMAGFTHCAAYKVLLKAPKTS